MDAFSIVDAHLHLWDTRKFDYPWLHEIPALNRSFLLEDYNQACGELPVRKMVFMQCDCEPAMYMEEVRWIAELARSDSRIQGIISYAPLELGEKMRPELQELKQNPLVQCPDSGKIPA